MRVVRGRNVEQLDGAQFRQLRAGFTDAVLDVGTGDGKHARQLALERADRLVIGLDAAKDGMRKQSAGRGRPNLLFVWAPVEQLPPELCDITEVHVLMPWGSLLRAMLGTDPDVLQRLATTCRPVSRFLVTFNLHAWRPRVPEVGPLEEPTPDAATGPLAVAYAAAGWRVERAWYPDPDEIASWSTSWTRRLTSSRDRLEVLAVTGTITGRSPGSV
ncbi:MAG: class I SAM-dependent methyltransferase [Actinobacteria bacterium]|nr:class I SAM-dependent methyltransferase [Actinomycetota bacterium]